MPESAEVRILAEQLNRLVQNSDLIDVRVLGGRFLKQEPKNLSSVWKALPIKIKDVQSAGKLIWFRSDSWFCYCTLGMTGTWTGTAEKHSAVRFRFRRQEEFDLFFTDTRHFGTISFEQDEGLRCRDWPQRDLLRVALSGENSKNLTQDIERQLS